MHRTTPACGHNNTEMHMYFSHMQMRWYVDSYQASAGGCFATTIAKASVSAVQVSVAICLCNVFIAFF